VLLLAEESLECLGRHSPVDQVTRLVRPKFDGIGIHTTRPGKLDLKYLIAMSFPSRVVDLEG